jgi:hypothetical protein
MRYESNAISNNYLGSLVYILPNNKVLVKYLNKDNYGYTYYTFEIGISQLSNLRKIDETTASALEKQVPDSELIKPIPVTSSCPDPNATVVVVSPFPESRFALVRIAVEAAHSGHNVAILSDGMAHIEAFLSYLRCPNVAGVYYLGNGNPNAITLFASNSKENKIVELTAKELRKAGLDGHVSSKIIEFNSCNTFNGELKQVFMEAGVKNYIAGKTYLSLPWSSNASELFWVKLIRGGTVKKSLDTGIYDMDPDYFIHQDDFLGYVDTWGIYGNPDNTLF